MSITPELMNSKADKAPEPEFGQVATCYHCGLPVPPGSDFETRILGQTRRLCCKGCEAVANGIVASGLEDFYKFRTENSSQGEELVPEFLRQARIYDNPEIQKSFVSQLEGQLREASLILEGITCAACIWLNERHLAELPGMVQAQINYATHRAQVIWDDNQIHLSDILQAIARIGYRAHPYDPNRQQYLLEHERKQQLKRLGLTAALGMQVMMLAVALYFGDWSGMENRFRLFFYWVSLILTTPVVLYSAQPFFRAAWRELRQWRVGMDVPVSLGILGAFSASVWTTVSGQGHVYYDSVVMFVFLLLTARFFELLARRRVADVAEQQIQETPTIATTLVVTNGEWVEASVAVAELNIGDRVLIRPGEPVPADGVILMGRSSVNESLLTGESKPILKQAGDRLIGGSLNIESPLEMEVQQIGQDTVLSQIHRLLDRAQAEKPKITQRVDRVASWFVSAVLVLAVAVGLYWWLIGSENWLQITIAVLVVSCPCALSLATPTAITASTGALLRLGLLNTRGYTLETLARVSHVVLDKTGTLTEGKLRLKAIRRLSWLSEERVLQLAAALERYSEHPIAGALVKGTNAPSLAAMQVVNSPGDGIEGFIEGQHYALGGLAFVRQQCKLSDASELPENLLHNRHTTVYLARMGEWLAAFEFGDTLRADARYFVHRLRSEGLEVWLLSGDHSRITRRIARTVGIDEQQVLGGLNPDEKLEHVQTMQGHGAVVAMVGDGVNDAPVLAGAQVSVAMGSGAQVAMLSADMIMLSNRLSSLAQAFKLGRKTRTIIRQNMIWAIIYNAFALPAAAMGFVAPWMAAIGMSLSSLIVVVNALRLTRWQDMNSEL